MTGTGSIRTSSSGVRRLLTAGTQSCLSDRSPWPSQHPWLRPSPESQGLHRPLGARHESSTAPTGRCSRSLQQGYVATDYVDCGARFSARHRSTERPPFSRASGAPTALPRSPAQRKPDDRR